MLTIFSCPKPFLGKYKIIQKNSIKSWKLLDPNIQIILLGDEKGVSEVAKEFGVQHIPNIKKNKFGTPFVNSLFETAEKAAIYNEMCYLNADIILLNNFIKSVKKVIEEKPCSIMVGRRWNLDIKRLINFNENWEKWIISELFKKGKLYVSFAMDYFVFPKGTLRNIPQFIIGRPAWDNWILYHAHSNNIPIVDLSRVVTVIHQNHDRFLFKEIFSKKIREEESKQNLKIVGEIARVYSILNANYYLTKKGLKKNKVPYYSLRFVYQFLVELSESYKFLKPLIKSIKIIGKYV